MRLFLFPLTTRRTLLYCERLHVATTEKKSIVDRVTDRAAKLWAGWEKKEAGWQKKVVVYGNYALRRIPYEEWGLKSVPPISSRRKDLELKAHHKVELHFPQSVISATKAEALVMRLATERDAIHRKRLIWCLVGMPITAPFALLPIIPNIPFFYLVYRAWSHWRARSGGEHVKFLVENKLLALAPSELLDGMYKPLLPKNPGKETRHAPSHTQPTEGNKELSPDEDILLTHETGRRIAQVLKLPELDVEMDRAIWQIHRARDKMAENDHQAATASSDKTAEPSKPDKRA